jgi:hypothetical protein
MWVGGKIENMAKLMEGVMSTLVAGARTGNGMRRMHHPLHSQRGFRRDVTGGGDSTSSRSFSCQSGSPRRARSAKAVSFSEVPGIASDASNLVKAISGGSKSQIPILIASKTDFGTALLLLQACHEISRSECLSILFLAKIVKQIEGYFAIMGHTLLGQYLFLVAHILTSFTEYPPPAIAHS